MRLASIAWRGLLARPLRTGLAVAGVALGVAVLTATIITGSASQQALRGATADLIGSADVRLRAFADAGFQPRTLQALRALPEAAVAAPVSERQLLVSTVPGENDQVFTLLVLGIDPEIDAEVRPPDMAEGTPLRADDATRRSCPRRGPRATTSGSATSCCSAAGARTWGRCASSGCCATRGWRPSTPATCSSCRGPR